MKSSPPLLRLALYYKIHLVEKTEISEHFSAILIMIARIARQFQQHFPTEPKEVRGRFISRGRGVSICLKYSSTN
jgi:hypothetical protein